MWNLFPAEDQAYHLVCSSNKVSTLGPNLANVVGALVCSNTLESEINVRVCLLILKDFPTRTALIPDRTFIKS